MAITSRLTVQLSDCSYVPDSAVFTVKAAGRRHLLQDDDNGLIEPQYRIVKPTSVATSAFANTIYQQVVADPVALQVSLH